MLCTCAPPAAKGLWHDTGFASLPLPPMVAFEISYVPLIECYISGDMSRHGSFFSVCSAMVSNYL